MAHLWPLLFLTSCLKVETQNTHIGIQPVKAASNYERAAIGCTAALLEKYFYSGDALSGSLLHMRITSAYEYVERNLLQALNTNPNYRWTIVVENIKLNKGMEYGNDKHILHEKPQCYFFVMENMEDVNLYEVFESWKTNKNWNPIAQFVVYFSSVSASDDEMNDIMTEIFLNFMDKKIYNVNIIGRSEENSFYVGKTVFPYHPDNNCGNRVISIETLDICHYRETNKTEMEESDEYEVSGNNEERDYGAENSEHKNSISKMPYSSTNEIKSICEKASSGIKTFDNPNDNSTQSDYPKVYIEEIYRALLFDKIPKYLSGCPLVAAFRPWEPYIFKEALDNSLYKISTDQEENKIKTYNDTYYVEEEKVNDEDYGDDEIYIVYNKLHGTEGKAPDSLSEIRFNGIEYKMIETIAERLHISIEMQVENNNLYHLFQQLLNGDVEMVVGGIDEDPNLSQFVSSTVPYHQDDLTWCVAKAQNTRNLFNFIATFKFGAWLLTLLFVLTASLCISMSQRCLKLRLHIFRSYFTINMYVMGIILSQSIALRPIPSSLKLCFGTIFFMGLMFSNTYQSFLVSTLTTSKTSNQISHLNEIYQNRMHIVGSVENVKHLNKEGEIYRYVREQFQMCYNIDECLQRAAKDKKLAVLVAREHFLYNPRIPRDNLFCFDRNQNIYVYLVTILMPKKFHLLHKINPVIQHIIESGHLQKWARDLDMRLKINENIQNACKQQLKSLTLSEVAGSFAFNGVLLLFALWSFLMEYLVHWLVVRRRSRLKLAKYLHSKLL